MKLTGRLSWAGAVALALLTGAPAGAGVVDRIAAVVNDEVITLTEVYELGAEFIEGKAAGESEDAKVRRAAELDVLDSLIQRRLVSQEITRLQLDVTDTEIDRTIDDIARRNGLDRDSLQREVEASGLEWPAYKDELSQNMREMKFSQAVIRPRIAVDEDELLDAYRRSMAEAELPEFAELGAIFMALPAEGADGARAAVMARAEAARTRVQEGEDFGLVSAELDEGAFGANGGAMGRYREGELVGALDAVAFGLAVGDTSAPVAVGEGIFVLHLFAKERADPPPLEEVRDQLFEQVYAGRIEAETAAWSEQARRRASVEIHLSALD